MSFSDAIGHIDQIVQWEQQLANPAAVTQTMSSGGSATTSGLSSTDTGTGGSTSFSNALAQAQAQEGGDTAALLSPSSGSTTSTSGLLNGGDSQLLAALSSAGSPGTGIASVTATTPATAAQATGADDPRISAMVQEADSLVGKPYVWGGGHSGWGPQSGYDCSGFVSAVLHAGGYLSSPQDTTTMPSAAGIEQGPGQYVTIYDRNQPGQEGHVIIEIDGQFYESGGEQGSWGGGGGVAKISTPSASYLATFNQVLHPAGL